MNLMRTALNLGATAASIFLLAALASSQNVIATIPIATASAGQVAVDPALNLVYAGGGPVTGGSSQLTVINGVTFAITKTITPSAGVSVDMSNDNIWTGNGSNGDVVVYNGNTDVEISSTKVGSCPAAVAFNCNRHIWVASQCGTGNDPVWLLNPKTYAVAGGPITPGGTIAPAPVVDPATGKLYVTSGGVSREINGTTFAVSNTGFGTVLAVDSYSNLLFATSGGNLQIIKGKDDTISKTVTLSYTPAAMGVNNAMSHVYLSNSTGNSIDVYNESGKKLSTFLLEAGLQPGSMAIDSVRGRLYVDVYNTLNSSWSLEVIEDLSTVRNCEAAGSCDY